jgi:adenylate cyclase
MGGLGTEGRGTGPPLRSIQDVAREANVGEELVRRLADLGVLPTASDDGYGIGDVRRARLLAAWEAAGLPLDGVVGMLEDGTLSLAFLDSPSMASPEPLDYSYSDTSASTGVPLRLVERLHVALGFAPPHPEERVRYGDLQLFAIAKMLLDVGVEETPVLGLVQVYADSLRRIAKATAELYESEIEEPLRGGGLSERQLIEFGTDFGERFVVALEQALLAVFRRHHEHVWIEHAVGHAEAALDAEGIREHVPEPPSICFVDLTGYTRLTEERGDRMAAQVARNLSALVHDISRRHGGRPIRWLGDGGMFHFWHPRAAVLAGLEMAEEAPRAGLPPTHTGIHTGPVIFQDGDVYGRTVNLAARIASQAAAGEVFVSEETVRRSNVEGLYFDALPPVALKGVAAPVRLYRASRRR